jgi:L-threonylcarbamoyladenylate synthase
MKTQRISINPIDPEPELIARAAEVLLGGGLVAFPTETVYGLAARAYDAAAVAKIFAAKGRPANNPLIVHLASAPATSEVRNQYWTGAASRLAARFWPGPLTLVLPKPLELPAIVTAGGPTWAIRVPDHVVAHSLILAAGPLAAPSANLSSGISATTADHVIESLGGRINLILDGGPCPGGIESTVLDLTSSPPRVLRPGPILPSALSEVIGELIAPELRISAEQAPLPAPGTSIRHYAPRTPLECFANATEALSRIEELCRAGRRVVWLAYSIQSITNTPAVERVYSMPTDAADYAAQLYDSLHHADRCRADVVVLNLPPKEETWLAVRDRLRRAASVWSGGTTA